MSLFAEIEDVISDIVEPPQRLYLKLSKWNKSIEIRKPNIEFMETSTNTNTKNILNHENHSLRNGKIVTDFDEIRRRLKHVKVNNLKDDVLSILDCHGISRRTKISKWYKNSCPRLVRTSDHLADQLYQIVQYYRSPTDPGSAAATKHKNVLGLLKMFYQKHGEN